MKSTFTSIVLRTANIPAFIVYPFDTLYHSFLIYSKPFRRSMYILFSRASHPAASAVSSAAKFSLLASSLKITPGQMGNMKGLIYIEGLTEKQVRQKLSHSKIIRTNRFGVNSCLYYILFEDVKGRYLCLFNSDKECFRALFFNYILLN